MFLYDVKYNHVEPFKLQKYILYLAFNVIRIVNGLVFQSKSRLLFFYFNFNTNSKGTLVLVN